MRECLCQVCGYQTDHPSATDLGSVRGNTARFLDRVFELWKCPKCHSIHSLDPVDFRSIYADYALNKRRLDLYARGTLRNLRKRLERAGLKKTDAVLDYGCGNGLFVDFLTQSGYTAVSGYDPFVREFERLAPGERFDCVIANDVIEHVPDPRATIRDCASLVKPGGMLYLGTADAQGVEMDRLEPHIMRLHQPFHRIIVTQDSLMKLAGETGMTVVQSYRRSYMDTLRPFANYRFLDEFNKALGHNLDAALEPSSATMVVRKPRLMFFGFLGYFFPSAHEPAVVMSKPSG